MEYKGIELKEVTEPQLFDQPKRMLVWDYWGSVVELEVCAIVKRKDYPVICKNSTWRHCAEIPKVPELKLATHRELARWLAEGRGEWKRVNTDTVYTSMSYDDSMDNDFVNLVLVRRWDDTTWRVPTSKYLGLEDK